MSSDLVDRVTTSKDISRNKKRKLTGKEQFFLVFRYVSLTILLVIAALPIYIMVINSVKGVTGVTQSAAKLLCLGTNLAANESSNGKNCIFCNPVLNHFSDYRIY